MKWALLLVASAVALVLVVSAIAYALLDEALLKKELSKALGREIAFARISPGLLKISVDDLGVGDLPTFENDPLLTARTLDLHYSLFSIFKGKLIIHRVVLSNARLALEHRGDTLSNYADLATRDKDGALLEVRELELEHLDLSLRIDSRVVEARGISGRIRDLASTPILFDLRGRVFDAPFAADGGIDVGTSAGRVKVRLEKLDLDSFPLAVESVDLAGLGLSLDGALGFSKDTFAWEGRADIPGLADVSSVLEGAWANPIAARGRVTVAAQAENLARIKPARKILVDYRVRGGFRVSADLTGEADALPKSVDGEFLGLAATPPQVGKAIEGITGRFRVTPAEAVLDNITFRASGSPIALSGRIGLDKMTLDLAVKTPQTEAADLLALAPASTVPAGVAASGPLALDLKVTGTVAAPIIGGRVDLAGLRVVASPPAVKKPATFEDLRGALLFDGKIVTLQKLAARYGSSSVSASGTYALAGGEMNLAVAGTSLDVGALAALAPTSPLPAGISMGGQASLDLKMTGRTEAPSASGWIKMEGMTIGLAEPKTDLENVRGRLDLAGDEVSLSDVTARMKSMAVAVSGTYHRKSEVLNLKIKADNIVLAELPGDLGAQALDVKGAASFNGSATGKASSPVVRGDLRSERLDLYGVAVSNMAATVTFDSPNMDVGKLTAGLLGGEIAGSAGMNIFSAARPFKLNLTGTALNFPDAIALGTRLAGSSFTGLTGGKISGKIDLAGTDFNDKSTLSGTGSADARDVDLGAVHVITTLSKALMAGQLKSISGIATALSSTDMSRYENVRGSFRIQNGRLNIDQTIRLLGSNDYAVGFRGSVDLKGSIEGLIAEVELPKAWFGDKALKIAQALTGATTTGNKVALPFSFTGSFSSPSPKPVFKMSAQSLLQSGLELLSGQPAAPASDGTMEAPDSPATALQTETSAAKDTPSNETPAPRNRRQRAIDLLGDILGK